MGPSSMSGPGASRRPVRKTAVRPAGRNDRQYEFPHCGRDHRKVMRQLRLANSAHERSPLSDVHGIAVKCLCQRGRRCPG